MSTAARRLRRSALKSRRAAIWSAVVQQGEAKGIEIPKKRPASEERRQTLQKIMEYTS